MQQSLAEKLRRDYSFDPVYLRAHLPTSSILTMFLHGRVSPNRPGTVVEQVNGVKQGISSRRQDGQKGPNLMNVRTQRQSKASRGCLSTRLARQVLVFSSSREILMHVLPTTGASFRKVELPSSPQTPGVFI